VKTLNFSVDITDIRRQLVQIQDFPLHTGKINFLFGESGIGKTLISKALFGLLAGRDLQVRLNDRPYEAYLHTSFLRAVRKEGFFVFQEPSSHLNPMLPIRAQLNEGDLRSSSGDEEILFGLWPSFKMEDIQAILDIFPKPYRPSGGEKQRILLAMALKKLHLMPPHAQTLYVFDEPTGSLDDALRNRFLELLLDKYGQRPFTILFITHDYSIISRLYQAHEDFLPHCLFKELQRNGNGDTRLSDFSTEDYLDWLGKLQPLNIRPPKKQRPVLNVSKDVHVFDRRLRLYRERQAADLQIRPGEMVYLKAPSGTGKTTLVKSILGLLRPQRIRGTIAGHPFTETTTRKFWRERIWGKRAGLVFQHADEALNLQSTVYQTFTGLPLSSGLSQKNLLAALQKIFDEPLTAAFLKRKIGTLSGGQKQRLNIMRTLILDLDLVVLDEPFNGLDFKSMRSVLNIIERKRQEGQAFLVIAHNEEIFSKLIPPANTYHIKEI